MQLDRVRRTALAVAVLSAVGAIAASTGAASTAPQPLASNSVTSLNGDGGTTTGPSGASDQTGPSGAPGSPSAPGVTGTSGASGATGASGPTGATGSTGASGVTGSSGTSGSCGTRGTSGTGGPSGPAAATGPAGATSTATPGVGPTGTAGTPTARFAPPVITSSQPQQQTGAGAGQPSSGHHSSHGPSSGSKAANNGPTAPSPDLFAGSNPLAGVLPGSWEDPFIVNGAAEVPQFSVQSFHIPPFLLSIYQAAGAAYGIPWQTLAAINEVETD